MFAVDVHGRIAVLHPRPAFAAHSMDTDWYAVDRQGHVGLWRSGEEGAVPYAAHRQPWDELCVDLSVHYALSLPETQASRSGSILLVDRRARVISTRELPPSWTGVLQFTSAEYLQMFRDEWAYYVTRTLDTSEHALQVSDLVHDAFHDYWSAGAIRVACVLVSHVTPAALGFYEYSCGFSGPYDRRSVPAHRLLLRDLPPPLRGRLDALQLGLDFDSTARFDPLSKHDCQTYR